MAKSREASDYDLLNLVVSEMDAKGVTRIMVSLDIDDATPDLLLEKFNVKATIEVIQHLADKCLANEWLEHRFLGSGQYSELTLTTSGHGVVRSLQAKEAAKAKRSTLKKASDSIEDHKGLLVVIGVVIALAGVLTKLGK